MADWRVSKEIVEVKPHLNADNLEILKVGEYQIVSGKDNYKTGDEVIIIPEKSIIPKDSPIYDEYEKYLTGPDKDRVKGIRLRGEISEAITWPLNDIQYLPNAVVRSIIDADIGEDLSGLLGITKYEAPIPYNMTGKLEPFDGYARNHDVYQYASYADEIEGVVLITEKIHGSQINYFLDSDGTESVSSKGILKGGRKIVEDEKNVYWQAARNSNLREVASRFFTRATKRVQLIGEVIPVQKGFTYGQDTKVVRLFDVVVDGTSVHCEDVPDIAFNLWVPVLWLGDVSEVDLSKLSKGKEQVSGNELHIKEGIVVKSIDKEKSEDGKRLITKVINPKYKDEDSFN